MEKWRNGKNGHRAMKHLTSFLHSAIAPFLHFSFSQFLHFSFFPFLFFSISPFLISPVSAQQLTFVELNCENLFDTRHDEGKQDQEFLPDGTRRWTRTRYWRKVNAIGQELLSCSTDLPDLVALVEVENDSAMRDLTRRSLLRSAGYDYLMTCSPDVRGIDVALLYHPARFRPLCYDVITVKPLPDMRPTRDILYVQGETGGGDTLHVFVVHAPSRYGGELPTRPHRQRVAETLLQAAATLMQGNVIVAGDFNDYADSHSLQQLADGGLVNVSASARGAARRALGTYRYQGEWHSIDHVLASHQLAACVDSVYVNDAIFLLQPDTKYGGWKPRRTYNGYQYQRGYSDHLPLVVTIDLSKNDATTHHTPLTPHHTPLTHE